MSDHPSKLYIHSLKADQLGDGFDDGLDSSVLRSLSSRAVVLSHPQDIVIVDQAPDPNWLKFLKNIGINFGTIHIAKGKGDTLIEQIDSDQALIDQLSKNSRPIEPYMGSDEIQNLSSKLKTITHAPDTNLLDRLNLKSNLSSILSHSNLPTIPTSVASRDDTLKSARTMLQTQSQIMVRADLSIGGHGVWKIQNESDLKTLSVGLQRSNPSRLFILQPFLDVANSPNVQYQITDTGPKFLGISSQQMTESFAFGGNEFPSTIPDNSPLHAQADKAAQWLHLAGYRGIVGIDFIVTHTNQTFIVEINPRVNTSTFPLLLSKRLGCNAFRLLTSIPTHGINNFQQLSTTLSSDLLYDQSNQSGCIPLMTPTQSRPLLDIMIFASDLQAVGELCDQLHRRMSFNPAETVQ